MDRDSPAQRQNTGETALALAAIGGCAESLSLLFQHHRPRLYANAVALLGFTSDAEDAVHDTFLVAIARIGQLREPGAFGGWLHAMLRNRCLMERRRRRPQTGGAEAERHFRELPDEERIETGIENRELRDWIWAALQKLPETQRVTVMLRYFGSCDSYEEVASILGVPIGTVRSRLFDAKIRLSDLLLSSAAGRDDAHEKLQAERKAFYKNAFHSLYRGNRDKFLSHYADDLHLLWSTGTQSHGREHFDVEMDTDLRTGVRIRPKSVMASGNVTVVEGVVVNPPEKPYLCPPGCVLVMKEGRSQVERLHIHLARRPSPPAG
ncbi:RNA polymerase sigma-70 factor, ECF subfamily [Mesorhizobium sp. NFR06]|uniref:RNA polymerase sigma factor n=1 Tax=Mesorhizobium sp. NFR06 TaxID=1566290 RepID=UPI0008EE5EC0|nr:RNA polymerase sigma factor [Mesorhizobium sp. NFR06]SFO33390.1 RNA polymerase sigma-70 factor, ECF subfamily [Mesorhizobium sp. NFR06]